MNRQGKKNSRCSPAASPASPFPVSDPKRALRTPATSGRKCAASLANSGPITCLAKMLLTSSIWGSTKRSLTWQRRDMQFGHSYFLLVPSAHGMNVSELLSWGLMFPTPLAADTGARTRTELISISPSGGFRRKKRISLSSQNGGVSRSFSFAANFSRRIPVRRNYPTKIYK